MLLHELIFSSYSLWNGDQYEKENQFPKRKEKNRFDLLVENICRVNVGENLFTQEKGIRGPILLDSVVKENFEIYSTYEQLE